MPIPRINKLTNKCPTEDSNRDPQSFVFQLMHPMYIPKQDPVLRIPQFHKRFFQNAPKVKNMLHFLHKLGQNLKMEQNVKDRANVKNVKNCAETWYVKKTLVILAQMGQMLRNERNAPFYKMGHVEKKCPKRQE